MKNQKLALIASVLLDDVRIAYEHDPDNWFRHPSLRLWRMAMRNLLHSRGFDVTPDELVLLVVEALNLN